MLKRFTPYIFSFIFGGVLISCGGGQQPDVTETDAVDSTEAQIEEQKEDENNLIMTLPSPLQIASIFRRSGLEHIPDITNSIDNISKYNTKNSQKLNFGVYSADLAYSALNDQSQDCINFVKNIGELSERLWLTNVFASLSILQRFEDNLGNSDSMNYVLADFQMELDSYLEENGLSQNSILIFTGAWVESMYIGLKSLENTPNTKLAGRLIEQKKIVSNLVKIVDTDDTSYMNGVLQELNNVNKHFQKFKGIEDIEDEIMLEEFAFTAEEQDGLLTDITALRNIIING